jgi:hypothetical protein
MGEHFDGANADELQAALDEAKAAGNTEMVRYYERVQADRKLKKADVEAHDIVLGNPEAYSKQTVAAQKEWAEGRQVDPVKFADLGLRGTEVAEDVPAPKPAAHKAEAPKADKPEAK